MNPIGIIKFRKSPLPLFANSRPDGAAKEGLCSSLWKREVRRDFIKQCYYYMPGLGSREI
jgi:hypothetical protein